jgi:hypothetical protein
MQRVWGYTESESESEDENQEEWESAPGLPKTWADVDPRNPAPISAAASGLERHQSPNTGTPMDDELAILRGAKKDEAVHKLISWTTLKDYPTHVGISLEIRNWVSPDSHEIQYWETTTFLPPICSAEEMCNWFVETLLSRSRSHSLPSGMPPAFTGLEAQTWRTGDSGRILFTPEESFAESMKDQTSMVQIEYGSGYARFGMDDTYTIAVLNDEFCALMGDDWSIYPGLAYRRLVDGTVQHHSVSDYEQIRAAVDSHLMFELPQKIQEDFGRGTKIANRTDQLRILDYWAQSNQSMLVGVTTYIDNHPVEYWLPMTLDPMPGEPLELYLSQSQAQ